jgi:hypothetical protein
MFHFYAFCKNATLYPIHNRGNMLFPYPCPTWLHSTTYTPVYWLYVFYFGICSYNLPICDKTLAPIYSSSNLHDNPCF